MFRGVIAFLCVSSNFANRHFATDTSPLWRMCCLHFTLFFRRAIEIDEEEDDKNVHSVPSQELNAAITDLAACLENLRTCNDLISKHGRALQSALFELQNSDDLVNKTKLINERATIFRISSNAMINVRV